MSHSISLMFLILNILLCPIFAQPLDDTYETLYRDNLPTRRSEEFGMTNGPDSEIFQTPLFRLQCEGERCEHNYVETVEIDTIPRETRIRSQKIDSSLLSNSTHRNSTSTDESYDIIASEYRTNRNRFQTPSVGRGMARRAICADQEYARRVSHDRRRESYRLECGRLAQNLRADPADTQERLLRRRRLNRSQMMRQASSTIEFREALCDNGYYIWGLACADTSCDFFNIICIRVLILRDGEENDEPMQTTATRVCNTRVCCPLSCGTCGGRDCARRDGGAGNCCESDIRIFSSVCDGPNDAPCIRSPEFILSTGVDYSFLQFCNGRVCCATTCEQCGGDNCGSFTGGSANCCNSRILSSGKVCHGPEDFPCILRTL